jgi:hypothetical protein
MPMFVQGRVAIVESGPVDTKDITPDMNVIFIRPKMDFGTKQKVIGAATRIIQGQKAKRQSGNATVDIDVGAYNMALLTNNILAWQGPAFAGVACTSTNIAMLDQDEPLVGRVLQEINDRNVTPGSAAPSEGAALDDPNVIELATTA